MRKSILTFFIALVALPGFAQQLSYGDAAQMYNRLLLEKGGDGASFQRISAYKVIGTQYLLGERHTGDLFAPGEMAVNIRVSYNTYNQQMEFYTKENPTKPLIKEAKEVDSFRMRPVSTLGVNDQLIFVNGKMLGAAPNAFYQRVVIGPKFSLYKKYKSTLGVVSTNYVDADLRQFNLEFDYFYYDHSAKQLKRLKQSQSAVEREFPQLQGLAQLFQDYPMAANPDLTLYQVFSRLNN